MNDWQIIELARIRQKEIDKEMHSIRLARLSRRTSGETSRKRNAILYNIGRVFISWGSFLQQKYGAATVESGSCTIESGTCH